MRFRIQKNKMEIAQCTHTTGCKIGVCDVILYCCFHTTLLYELPHKHENQRPETTMKSINSLGRCVATFTV